MSDQRQGGISWTEETWNPVRGCSRVSEGCRNCYAERQAGRMADGAYKGLVKLTPSGPRWTGRLALVEDKISEPLRWSRPRLIFVNSMSDLFHEALTDEQIARVFAVMALAPRHTFQVLTKRAGRMRKWFTGGARPNIAVYDAAAEIVAGDWSKMPGDMAKTRSSGGAWWPLPNVWLGVSVEDQASADERIPDLLETPAAVRWVSYEPAIGLVDFRRLKDTEGGPAWINALSGDSFCPGFADGLVEPFVAGGPDDGLHWIVVGGESGPGARPFDLAWARATIAAGRAAGVPIFVKQLGSSVLMGPKDRGDDDPAITREHVEHKGGRIELWTEDLKVREWPMAKETVL